MLQTVARDDDGLVTRLVGADPNLSLSVLDTGDVGAACDIREVVLERAIRVAHVFEARRRPAEGDRTRRIANRHDLGPHIRPALLQKHGRSQRRLTSRQRRERTVREERKHDEKKQRYPNGYRQLCADPISHCSSLEPRAGRSASPVRYRKEREGSLAADQNLRPPASFASVWQRSRSSCAPPSVSSSPARLRPRPRRPPLRRAYGAPSIVRANAAGRP
jgi:hypothetical protein